MRFSQNPTRRDFLKKSAAATAVLALPTFLPGEVLGLDGATSPNNKIVVGGIGINNRGGYVLSFFLNQKDVRFAAVADIRRERREQVKEWTQREQGTNDVGMYRDFRELLERPDIDAVLIATGDRWHAHMSIYAARAGKDVYSEKPCAITIELCGKLADTMKQYGTVFQGGTQRRNVSHFRYAVDLARTGRLGKLHTMHASIYHLRQDPELAWLEEQPMPDKNDIDWDLWLGPAAWRPYNINYVMGSWRGHYDFDSGTSHHDWGVHSVDLCQFALGDPVIPARYRREGHRLYAEYENGIKLVMRPDDWMGLGMCPVRFEGSEGWVEAGDSGLEVSHPSLRGLTRDYETQISDATSAYGHVREFLDCVKSRKQPICNADIIRNSHVVCHASAINWLLNRDLRLDPKTETFIGDDEANRMRSFAQREPWVV